MDDCILSSQVLRLPLQLVEGDIEIDDLDPSSTEELQEQLRQAERFYRSYCRECDLAGGEEQRLIGLGLFLLGESVLGEQKRPVRVFRETRKARKAIERREAGDQDVPQTLLIQGMQAGNRVTRTRDETRETPIEALLRREEDRLIATLSRVLSLEENTRALLRGFDEHLQAPPESELSDTAESPTSELAFLESWERRLKVVSDDLSPPQVTEMKWVREEQSALPASRTRMETSGWNRSVRFIGEVDGQARVVIEVVLETDLARAPGDRPRHELMLSLIEQRRRNATTNNYHHIVGFARSGAWPPRVERLADRFGADSLDRGSTTVAFINLRAESSTIGGQGQIHDSLSFAFDPSTDQKLLEEVRKSAEGPLSEHGFVEFDRLEMETALPRSAVRWLLDRLPWDGEKTHVEGVGEVYRRPLMEG